MIARLSKDNEESKCHGSTPKDTSRCLVFENTFTFPKFVSWFLASFRDSWPTVHRADVPANIVSPIIDLLALNRCLGYYRSTNLRFIKARPILSLSFIYRPLIFDIRARISWTVIYRPIFTSPILNHQLDNP